jgi:hypothetical protein
MESNEKQIIDNLFSRLQQAEAQSGPRDTAAETLIRQAVDRQPAAPYYMAQAILVQEQALQNLNHRVQELEQELAQRPAGGGFLAGLFGGGNKAATPVPPVARSPLHSLGPLTLSPLFLTAVAAAFWGLPCRQPLRL